jgi:xylan 1,4-beta-xylosidase
MHFRLSFWVAGILCVCFSGNASAEVGATTQESKIFPSVEPDTKAKPITVDVRVFWNSIIGKMSPMMWGVCDDLIMSPDRAKNAGFNDYLKSLGGPLIRIHGEQNAKWIDKTTHRWDAEKIKAGFEAAPGYKGATLMMTISAYPLPVKLQPWGGFASEADENRQVQLAVELVRIMRDTVKRKVDYWEIYNERDGWDGKTGKWEKYGKLDEYWRLINKTALAIKKEDPTAKVGAAAFTLPRPEWISGLMTHCGKNLDFVSWHNYATGDAYASNEFVFGMIDEIENTNRDAIKIIRKYDPGRRLKIFLSEYNINWNWEIDDPRMRKSFAAVYDACLLKREALLGVDGAAVWHTKNWLYGLIGEENPEKSVKDNFINPSGYLIQCGNAYLVGRIANVGISDKTCLDGLAVIAKNGKSVLLMNKTSRTVIIPHGRCVLGSKNDKENGKSVRVMTIDSRGLTRQSNVDAAEDLKMGGYSVMLITNIPPDDKNDHN